MPEGFAATKDAYADWLAGEVKALGEPVDLVGHDWGALLTIRLATAYGVPLRSWVADVASLFHPGYSWHPRAQRWITPGDGEVAVDEYRSADADSPDGIAGTLRAGGNPDAAAKAMAAQLDATTMRAILALYRSAAPNPHQDWRIGRTTAPGLVVIATGDKFVDPDMSREVAATLEAEVVELPGLRHGWMADDPAVSAEAIAAFWARTR